MLTVACVSQAYARTNAVIHIKFFRMSQYFPKCSNQPSDSKETVKNRMWSFDWTLKRGEKKGKFESTSFFEPDMTIKINVKKNNDVLTTQCHFQVKV